MDELYFSVARIKVPASPLLCGAGSAHSRLETAVAHRESIYLWAIWDIFPSMDVYRPPLLSGPAAHKSEILSIAGQYGIEAVKFGNADHINTRLTEYARRKGPLESFIKRRPGVYAYAKWSSVLAYLLGADPIALESAIPEAQLTKIIGAAPAASGFIQSHIRKKEAIKRLSSPSFSTTDAAQVEFVYADHKENYYGTRPLWRRHRIIKRTAEQVFIDRFPYLGGPHIPNGWRSMIVYAIIIGRQEYESSGVFYHSSLRTHFYKESHVKRHAPRQFKLGGAFDDPIIELPANSLQWALNMLGIDHWPTSRETIKKAFAVGAMKHHPDRGGDAEKFIKIRAARIVLLEGIK